MTKLPDGRLRLQKGELVLGRYRIERVLDSGAEGTAWLATDERTSERVVAKQYKQLEAMHRESALLRAVSSPHVVRYVDADDERGVLVREFVEGPTLLESDVDPMSIAVDYAEAVRAMAVAGYLYVDMSPANIVLSSRGAVVIDCGCAQEWMPPLRQFQQAARANRRAGGTR